MLPSALPARCPADALWSKGLRAPERPTPPRVSSPRSSPRARRLESRPTATKPWSIFSPPAAKQLARAEGMCGASRLVAMPEDPLFSANPRLAACRGKHAGRAAYTGWRRRRERPGSSPGPSGKACSISFSSMKPARSRWPTPWRWLDARRTSFSSATRCSSNNPCKVRIPAMPDFPPCNTL